MRNQLAVAVIACTAAAAGGCGGGGLAGVCANRDGELSGTSFVFVQEPASGEHVPTGFRVSGCSSTFEATVAWSLRARDGRVLAKGVAQGGGLEPAPFRFTVSYAIASRQVGQLEVDAPSVTTEGYPPVRNAVPLVLEP